MNTPLLFIWIVLFLLGLYELRSGLSAGALHDTLHGAGYLCLTVFFVLRRSLDRREDVATPWFYVWLLNGLACVGIGLLLSPWVLRYFV